MSSGWPTIYRLGGTWKIDALESQAVVSVWHFNVAYLRAKLATVMGFTELDPENPLRSTFAVEIEAASITTGHPRQQEFMRSDPWLDPEHFPLITFKGSEITPREGGCVVAGELHSKVSPVASRYGSTFTEVDSGRRQASVHANIRAGTRRDFIHQQYLGERAGPIDRHFWLIGSAGWRSFASGSVHRNLSTMILNTIDISGRSNDG